MKERRLGKTGLRVSEIGFGCWPIGGNAYGAVRDEDSLDALEVAWDSGVNFFDTADIYGEGRSEALIGKFLQGKSRDSVIVASKCGWDFYPPSQKPALLQPASSAKNPPAGHRKNFDPRYIRFACEQSLGRLGTDRIDLFQLHNPSLELIQSGEPVGVLEGLRKEGKIRFIGVSVHKEVEAFAALQDARVHTIQVIFNLLDQRMAERIFPEADKKNVGVIVREPLASGILSGKYLASHEFPKDDHRRRWSREKKEADFQKVRLLQKAIKSKNTLLAKAALEFALAYDAVSTVIPGAKTRTQVLQNVEASARPDLEHEDIDRLESLYAQEEIFRRELNPQ